MCNEYVPPTADQEPAQATPSYVVDSKHPLADATLSTAFLKALPTPLAAHMRETAKALSDVLLAHIMITLDPVYIGALSLIDHQRGMAMAAAYAATDEEVTARYLAGSLNPALAAGGSKAATYLNSDVAKAEIAAFRASMAAQRERGAATLN